jgi:hypothetical protein
MQAYSLDLRERVVRAVDQGHPRSETIKHPSVSSGTSGDEAKPGTTTSDQFLVVLLRNVSPCVKSW